MKLQHQSYIWQNSGSQVVAEMRLANQTLLILSVCAPAHKTLIFENLIFELGVQVP